MPKCNDRLMNFTFYICCAEMVGDDCWFLGHELFRNELADKLNGVDEVGLWDQTFFEGFER